MNKNLKNIITILILLTISIVLGAGIFNFQIAKINKNDNASVLQQTITDKFSYKGKNNQDALTLLKQQAAVILDSSGMVNSINGRKADSKKREFWAFYINGKLASIGPASYNTKNQDIIEWRIEKY